MNDETRDNSIEKQDDDAPERTASEDLKPEGEDAEERDPSRSRCCRWWPCATTVIFPEMIVPLQVGRERSVKALDRAVRACSRWRSSPSARTRPKRSTPSTSCTRWAPGQDRPGHPPAGRHHPRHRPGPAPDPAARPGSDGAAPRGAGRAGSGAGGGRPGGRGPDGIGPGPDRAVRQLRASVPPEVAVAARNITDGGLLADMVAYSRR